MVIAKHYKENNFDLIRLLAAVQVLVVHAAKHLHIEDNFVLVVLRQFPGVPIFFSIRGFLIFWSFDRKPGELKAFYKNRLIRIYPGLWGCLLFMFIVLLNYIPIEDFQSWQTAVWWMTNGSVLQFYTPDFMRSWGVGAPNGSLWTISVELQYYLVLPFIYSMLSRKTQTNRIITVTIFLLILIGVNMFIKEIPNASLIKKMFKVSLLPYAFYFFTGILIYIVWDRIYKYLQNKFLWYLIAYMLYFLLMSRQFGLYGMSYWPNFFGIIATLLLILMCFSLAFTRKGLSSRILKGNDISYGTYLYHMVIINIFVAHEWFGGWAFFFALLTSILMGLLSWFVLEQKFLKLKKHPLKQRKV